MTIYTIHYGLTGGNSTEVFIGADNKFKRQFSRDMRSMGAPRSRRVNHFFESDTALMNAMIGGAWPTIHSVTRYREG